MVEYIPSSEMMLLLAWRLSELMSGVDPDLWDQRGADKALQRSPVSLRTNHKTIEMLKCETDNGIEVLKTERPSWQGTSPVGILALAHRLLFCFFFNSRCTLLIIIAKWLERHDVPDGHPLVVYTGSPYRLLNTQHPTNNTYNNKSVLLVDLKRVHWVCLFTLHCIIIQKDGINVNKKKWENLYGCKCMYQMMQILLKFCLCFAICYTSTCIQ